MFHTRIEPRKRGFHAAYHEGEVNHCPGCGRTHWHIGRLSAECAFCSAALPLMATLTHEPGPAPAFFTGPRRHPQLELEAA